VININLVDNKYIKVCISNLTDVDKHTQNSVLIKDEMITWTGPIAIFND
jgi:hypothetical protein